MRWLLILILFIASCTQDEIHVSYVSNEDAQTLINSDSLVGYTPIEINDGQDSMYCVLSVKPEFGKSDFEFFMRRNTVFHVYQNSKLIYKNDGLGFYPPIHTNHSVFSFFRDDKKSLFQLPISVTDSLKFLIHKPSKYDISSIFELVDLANLERKKPVNTSMPWLRLESNCELTDTSYVFSSLQGSDSVKVKIRGSSSKSFPKKQFGMKRRESFLLDSIWFTKAVLHAPYIDRSLIRNKLSYDLFGLLSDSPIPSFFTQTIVNGNYEGIYLLMHHPKNQFKQSDISAKENSFLVQIDRCPCSITHSSYNDAYIKPAYVFEQPSKPTDLESNLIDAQLISFETALYAGDLSIIDKKSFANLVILNELSKNIDAYRLSTYLAFDGTTMSIPTVWDYNIAWGLAKHAKGFEPSGFVIDGEHKTAAPFWWQSLWGNEAFQTHLKELYTAHRTSILSTDSLHSYIDNLVLDLAEDKELNFERWPLFGKNIWPNKYKSESHQDEISTLKKWIEQRLLWLDSQWLLEIN